ncbi:MULTISPECIES: hypothetical protein [Pseudomonas syringae group]|uniref:hypothetical protein n=1 Tax=Pseudomonas syringae group TaxID=136849 RepID=UPI0007EE59A7|nr:hypothetical protein [Pseudomonas syringae]OBS35877.1 hypothetical protein A9K81_05650 [Pseudomonas syringae pv. syringae]
MTTPLYANAIVIWAFIAFAPLCIAMFRQHRKPTAVTLLCVITVGILMTGHGPVAALVIWLPNIYWAATGKSFHTPAR